MVTTRTAARKPPESILVLRIDLALNAGLGMLKL